MKKLLMIVVLVAFVACKKDETPTSPPPPSYTKVYVEKITLEDMPFTDTNGSGWDAASGPDPYCILATLNGVTIHTTAEATDITPSSLPIIWTVSPSILLQNDSLYYTWVYNSDVLVNDLIGVTNGFYPAHEISVKNFPATFEMTGTRGTKVKLDLHWE